MGLMSAVIHTINSSFCIVIVQTYDEFDQQQNMLFPFAYMIVRRRCFVISC